MGITQDHLDAVIDEVGLIALIEEIAQICRLKAEHLRANWQDETSARAWLHDAKTLERIEGVLKN